MTFWLNFDEYLDLDLFPEYNIKEWENHVSIFNLKEDALFKLKANEPSGFKIDENNSFSTNIPNFDSPDLFLEYLDKYFKPEINLHEDSGREKNFKETVKETINTENEEIKLNYKGHKHMNEKGKNAERRDVAYKTFLRSTRRYLWELFSKKYDIKKLNGRNRSLIFKEYVTDFYNEYFKSYVIGKLSFTESQEDNIKFLLSIILSEKNSFPSKTTHMRNLIILIKSWMKSFDSKNYTKFFSEEGVSDLFKIIFETGFIHRAIEVYPKLNSSRDSYLKVIENIMSFPETKTLLQSNLKKC